MSKDMSENIANSVKTKSKDMSTPSKEEEMNSKRIGNIGEAKALCKFVELGIPVYLPFGDNEKSDLIADFNGKLNRLQIKTSLKAEDGVMKFDLTSSTAHRKNGVKHKYSKEEIDYFVCYNIARDKIFLVPIEDAPSTALTIRYEAPKNGQSQNIKFEKDYLLENLLCVETLEVE